MIRVEKNGFQKHGMHITLPNSEIIPGTSSNIILFNSNDRSSALKLYYGLMRRVCSNGMVLGGEDSGDGGMKGLTRNRKTEELDAVICQNLEVLGYGE